eukprot:CAMPEP_0206228944 /NCGR_PEP_ID=MMETSP0047_2-20121206/9433_1 /ASSEMBLY_ACC=CAM_ASM_000192 /TAXON_ID=195065 /ORGANISM="Chroomonas mesostigmatica_cf, Strain CCMP1168" /LENGTH=191 /DNA_ID=CAMNT_0053652209 /DNA_START=243 /DNA_END=818 /DNA_ORIENTATION=-
MARRLSPARWQRQLGVGRSQLGISQSLGGKADDAAREARAGVPSGLGGEALLARLAVVALAKVISELVDDHGPAQDAVGPGEGDLLVVDGDLGDAISACSHVPEVASVPLIVAGGAVGLAGGVKVGAAAHAPVGGVAKLVDVEAVLASGEPLDLTRDGGAVGGLGEGDGALHAGGALEDADSLSGHLGQWV